MSDDRVELPVVTETNPESTHVSLLLVADGLRQTETNLKEQEANINRLTEQLQQLQNMRIATIAQRNLLTELEKKITELENTGLSAS
jgi:septal ring factor EnvC (AmiA/AmiB activator)